MENSGNQVRLKELALRKAQRTTDVKKLVDNLMQVKEMKCNQPHFNPLDETVIEGIRTNIPLHQDILRGNTFQKGLINIHYLEKWMNR